VVRCERGAELVEFALIMPLLVVLAIGIIDFGLAFRDMAVVTNAAREGARVRVLPGYTDQNARDRANAYLQAAGLQTVTGISVTKQTVSPGGTGAAFSVYRVEVDYPHAFIAIGPVLTLLGTNTIGSTITLTGVATMRSEL